MFEIVNFFNLIGTIAFGVSGTLVAKERGFDILGISLIGFITANGGGTIRDVLLGHFPIFWIKSPFWLLCPIIASLLAVLFWGFLSRRKLTIYLQIFDALGLTTFAILGTIIAHNLHISMWICPIMGAITGVGGGVIRDLLCNQTVFILKGDFYAFVGYITGIIYLILSVLCGLPPWSSALAAIGIGLTFRIFAYELKFGFK